MTYNLEIVRSSTKHVIVRSRPTRIQLDSFINPFIYVVLHFVRAFIWRLYSEDVGNTQNL